MAKGRSMVYVKNYWANKNAQHANKRFHSLSERSWVDKPTRQVRREWKRNDQKIRKAHKR